MNKTFTDFFGFTEDPFKRTPDIDFYFFSKHHQEALNTLNYLLQSDEGFAVIEGEPGTGKSVTIRRFIQDLPSNVVFAYILFPNLKPEELFQAVLEDFGIPLDPTISKNALFSRFKDFLISTKEQGKTVLIIVDEAQNLPMETLEEFRILSNLETDKEKLLKIALVGQPELKNKLESKELRQLKQRITLLTHLRNLTVHECLAYINYRIEKAGRTNLKISDRVVKLVWIHTDGNPRLVNTLMERSIIAAYIDGMHTVKSSHVHKALNSMNNITEMKRKTSFRKKAALSVAVIVLLTFAALGYHRLYFKINPTVVAAADTAPKQTTPAAPTPPVEDTPPPIVISLPLVTPEVPKEAALETPPVEVPAEPIEIPADPVETPATPVEITIPEIPGIDPAVVFGVDNTAIVNAPVLNVRVLPLLNAERIGSLYEGQKVTVKEESLYWVRIVMPDSRDGWVYKEYLRKEEIQ